MSLFQFIWLLKFSARHPTSWLIMNILAHEGNPPSPTNKVDPPRFEVAL